MPRFPVPPAAGFAPVRPGASRRRRPWLPPLLGGCLALLLAHQLARFIAVAVAARQADGLLQLARDGRLMLWSPVLLALAGGLALLRGLWLLRPARGERRPAAKGSPPPGRHRQRSPAAPPAYASPLQPLPAVDTTLVQAWKQLGLEPGSPWSLVRATWRRQLRHWHPDAGGDPQLWHQRLAAYRTLQAAGLRR